MYLFIEVGHTHEGSNEMENLNNPELLHPEIHFHPTHLHRSDISNKSNMHEDHENLGTSYSFFNRVPIDVNLIIKGCTHYILLLYFRTR